MLGTGKTRKRFILPDSLDFPRLRKEVSANFPVRRGVTQAVEFTLFDTFDWRLFRKGKLLAREGDRLLLTDLGQGLPTSQSSWLKQGSPRFWWDLPEGDLRSRLQILLDVRALLPLLFVAGKRRGQRILNSDQKTVLRVYLCSYDAEAEAKTRQKVARLELEPILGYGSEFREFQAFLRDRDITEEKENLSLSLMRQLGLRPGGYSSKFLLSLDPALAAGEAVRRILRHLLDVMVQNEEGIKADTDTEFLHDYRVSIRRIRSALGQIKGIFPSEDTARFREDLARLGQATNTLRDLDVYLLKQEGYRALLPAHLACGLDPLFQDLAEARKKEQRAVALSLNSAAYRRTVTRWREYLESTAGHSPEEAPCSQRPIHPLAARIIFRRYRLILREGGKIGDDSPDEDLHRLRINCKKLRYLLEFFASLFPEKDVKRAVAQLKKLQDNLGVFNDLFIQQSYLESHLKTMEGDEGRLRFSAAAVGGLITSLNQKQQDIRLAYAKCFRAFSSPRNHARFVRLFKSAAEGDENP